MNVVPVEQNLPATLEDAQARSQAIARALRRAARKAGAPTSIISGGAGFRASKKDRAFRIALVVSFMLVAFLPFVAESVYWGLVASRQYSTEMKFAVRSSDSQSGSEALAGVLGGLAGAGGPHAQDTQIVANYIRSRAMVEALDASLDLRRIYARDDADYFSRFDPEEPVEELEKYWGKRVDTRVEPLSNIISVDVRAFTPEDSLALAKKIVELSEKLVNDLSTRSRRDALAQARNELERAEQRLRAATAAMRDTRDAEGVLDANAAADAINKLITELRLDMSRAVQDLASLGRAATESPQARVLRARIASIKAQIDDYSTQIAGAEKRDGPGSIAARAGQLSRTQVELDLMRQQYARAAATFESARADMDTQHAYLVSFVTPALAQKSTYPRRWWQWSIVVIPCLLGWGVLAGVALLVRDHMAK